MWRQSPEVDQKALAKSNKSVVKFEFRTNTVCNGRRSLMYLVQHMLALITDVKQRIMIYNDYKCVAHNTA